MTDLTQFCSTAEAAEIIGCTRQHVVWLIDQDKLRAEQVGRAYLIRRTDAEKCRAREPGPGRPRSKQPA